MRPVSAEVLGKTMAGDAVLVRNAVGRGQVYYFSDPAELDDSESGRALRRGLYAAFLRAARVLPLVAEPDVPWLHVLAQPTAEGTVHIAVNTKTAAGAERVQIPTASGPVRWTIRNRWPAMAAVTRDGKVIGVGADGTAAAKGESLMDGAGLKLLLSLDGEDLRRAASLLIAPLEPGRIELPPRPAESVAVVGEFCAGRWVTYQRVPLDPRRPALDIDADRATCLILVCPPAGESRCVRCLNDGLR
jgi:hypothetical protein